jgi:F-type H+-transporting ATPase subunit b
MEFDWTTFVLEAINFLVLLWLLKRFFYRPVLAVIEQRQARTAKTIADAATVQHEAEALKSEYQTRLAHVDEARAAAQEKLDGEIAAERGRRLAALDAELAVERKRRETLGERERSDLELALERQAMTIATRYATRLLDRVAGPELEAKLADLALSELAALTSDKLEALRIALREPGLSVQVASAYPLDEAHRAAFSQALGKLAGRTIAPEFSEDAGLKAGVCIMAGSWVLMANLRDELGFFAGGLEHGG